MLTLKVRKIGRSLGLVLPKEAVSRLKADEGDRLRGLVEAVCLDLAGNLAVLLSVTVWHVRFSVW